MVFISDAVGLSHGGFRIRVDQLGLVAQPLLMAILLHALAALVVVDLGFSSFFQ
jgi:hypothetical protein